MEERRLGRTASTGTSAIPGAAAFWQGTQAVADEPCGTGDRHWRVYHIDVAPRGLAEERPVHWLAGEGDRFFVACKRVEWIQADLSVELRRSLERLQVGVFDQYQLHCVTFLEELDQVAEARWTRCLNRLWSD